MAGTLKEENAALAEENAKLAARIKFLEFEVDRLNNLLGAYQGETDWRERI